MTFAVIIVAAAVVVVALKAAAVRTFEIPSESMSPTLTTNDRIAVELISPHFDPYKRGDVVVFRDPDDWLGNGQANEGAPSALQLLGLAPEPNGYLVKRILATPGETVEGLADGTLLIDGETLNDPYGPHVPQDPFVRELGDDEYWMMGDNRGGSADSRAHGPVAEDDLIGRVAFVFYPWERLGGLS